MIARSFTVSQIAVGTNLTFIVRTFQSCPLSIIHMWFGGVLVLKHKTFKNST